MYIYIKCTASYDTTRLKCYFLKPSITNNSDFPESETLFKLNMINL